MLNEQVFFYLELFMAKNENAYKAIAFVQYYQLFTYTAGISGMCVLAEQDGSGVVHGSSFLHH